jgi:hypothetical protein
LWQEKHETVPVEESRGSKKSILPNSTFAGVLGFAAGSAALAGKACQSVNTGAAFAKLTNTDNISADFIMTATSNQTNSS